ncbi:hypothetical protein FB451DRAFT_1399500 [Mycena latifolia]|nr:hypothetical protein FB451DRAFT_1419500 [Mycena latifolia]KAJ7470741.1 hypothetical protein FB451DRAFT_1399500 [Mycena latifolia]
MSVVNALPDSNAQRLARGLPPLPPRRRQHGAKRTTPSSTPYQCNSKKTFCCSDLTATSSSAAKSIISGLEISSSSCGEHIGTGCVAAFGDSCIIGTPANCCFDLILAHCFFLIFTPHKLVARDLERCEHVCLAQQLRLVRGRLPLVFGQHARLLVGVRISLVIVGPPEQLRARLYFAFKQCRVLGTGLSLVFGQQRTQLLLRLAQLDSIVFFCIPREQLGVFVDSLEQRVQQLDC